MTALHGMMTRDADGRMEACEFANPDNVLRGTPDEKAFAANTFGRAIHNAELTP